MTAPFKLDHLLLIITGPAAAGKTAIAEQVLLQYPGMQRVRTCTTRQRRESELDRDAYHFLSEAEFEQGVKEKHFLEHAEVHGMYYGTRINDMSSACEAGPALIALDPQGAATISSIFPSAICVFIMAPNPDIEKRLVMRSSGLPERERRISDSKEEMQTANERHNKFIINNADGELERSLQLMNFFISLSTK